MITKLCKICNIEKPLEEMVKNKGMKDGYVFKCKKCRNEYNNTFFKNYKEIKRKYDKEYRKLNKHKYKEYYNMNRDIINANQRRSKKDKHRKYNLKNNYNITIEDYNIMFKEQEGKCSICKRHQSEFKKSLCVDHNHETGEIRGLLCSKCNLVLGNAEDNINILNNAIQYLTQHN